MMTFSDMVNGLKQPLPAPYEVYTDDGLILETRSRVDAFNLYLDLERKGKKATIWQGSNKVK